MVIISPWNNSFLKKNQLNRLDMIFKTVNELMMKIAVTKLEPSPQPYLTLQWIQIRMSSLDMAHRQFSVTPNYKYQYQ